MRAQELKVAHWLLIWVAACLPALSGWKTSPRRKPVQGRKRLPAAKFGAERSGRESLTFVE